MTSMLVERGDLEYIRSQIELGEYNKALEVLEEILEGKKEEELKK